MASNFTWIAAGVLPDGRIQLFANSYNSSSNSNSLFSRWKETTDTGSAWTPWYPFQTPQDLGSYPILSIGYLPDKSMQLFLLTGAGTPVTCYKTSPDPNASWTPWQPF